MCSFSSFYYAHTYFIGMFVRKKKDALITPDTGHGNVYPTRTYNVRNQPVWPIKILCNNESFDAVHDEHDEQHKLFFECVLPEANDDILMGDAEEELDLSSFEALSVVTEKPRIKYSILPRNEIELVTPKQEFPICRPTKVLDFIELSDTDDDNVTVVEEVKKTKQWKITDTIVQQRLRRNMEKLSSFLMDKGIENTNTLKIPKKNVDYDSCTSNLMDDLREHYLEVNSSKYPRKRKFMMIPDGKVDISTLIDSPVKKVKAVKKEKKESKKVKDKSKKDSKDKSKKIPKRVRSPSPIFVKFSSDDDDNHIKDGIESILKNGSPSEGPKNVPIWKKKADQDSSNVPSLPAHETFVPRKEAKLRTSNLVDFMKKNESARKEAERQKEKLARSEREKREKADELKIIDERKRKKNEELPPVKYKIPRKEGAVPPSDKSPDTSEPPKKKICTDVPISESCIDILGAITEAMNAEAAAKANEAAERTTKDNEDWVPPRMYEQPIEPPSCPPRFAVQGDGNDDDMDISISKSPEKSPRPLEDKNEKTISPVSSDEGIEMERKARMEDGVSPTTGGSIEELVNDRVKSHLNLDETKDLGDLHCDDIRTAEYLREDLYRMTKVDGVKVIKLLDAKDRRALVNATIKISIDKYSEGSDPRLPGPSPGSLSRFKNTRMEISLDGADKLLDFGRDEVLRSRTEDEISTRKKKGVQWGETAIKEFNPNEDIGGVDVSKKNEMEEVIGKKKVGEREYNIVKKTIVDAPPSKSCLKPICIPSGPIDPLYPPGMATTSRTGHIRPPMTPPLDELKQLEEEEEEGVYPVIRPIPPIPPTAPTAPTPTVRVVPPSLNIAWPQLPDFVPPPGFEVDPKKKEKEEREKREKEEKEMKEKEEKEKAKRDKEDRERREREEEERERREREEEDRRRRYDSSNSGSSPEEGIFSSSMKRDSGDYERRANNFSAGSSFSMINLKPTLPSTYPPLSGASASLSTSNVGSGGIFEIGSEVLGDRPPMQGYPPNDVKYQLEMRMTVAGHLDLHKTMTEDPSKEYPSKWNNKTVPPEKDQHGEQDRYIHELTSLESDWKDDGLQPVWLQSLPYQTNFSFDRNAGLYWPIVQATDRIEEDVPDFESIDVLRILGNNTHFATEKKALLGMEVRLPNGMTHRERFEMAFNGESVDWKENQETKERFTNRRMYSRVFNRQKEDDAREIHNERWMRETQLLKEHEEIMKRNAPQGVTISESRMEVERPTRFHDFPDMIQHYKKDDYENVVPTQDNDWYCNESDFYMPYVERAAYLCHVINHFNERYNDLYNVPAYDRNGRNDRKGVMMDLDGAAFAAAQIALGRMEGWNRVGIPESEYSLLMRRNKERINMIDSSSFSVNKYMELTNLVEAEKPYFHFIVDWLSSIYKSVKPIHEWRLNDPLHLSFKEAVMISAKKDDNGRCKDARKLFYIAFHDRSKSLLPPNAKKSRSSTYNCNWDGF